MEHYNHEITKDCLSLLIMIAFQFYGEKNPEFEQQINSYLLEKHYKKMQRKQCLN